MKFVIRGIEFVPCTGGEKTKQEKAMVRGKHAPSVKHRPAVPAGDGADFRVWCYCRCCSVKLAGGMGKSHGAQSGA